MPVHAKLLLEFSKLGSHTLADRRASHGESPQPVLPTVMPQGFDPIRQDPMRTTSKCTSPNAYLLGMMPSCTSHQRRRTQQSNRLRRQLSITRHLHHHQLSRWAIYEIASGVRERRNCWGSVAWFNPVSKSTISARTSFSISASKYCMPSEAPFFRASSKGPPEGSSHSR